MKRIAVALALAVLGCSARSEPRGREPVSSPPRPSPTPPDALTAVPTPADAPDVVTVDAPVTAPDRPMTPRTLYPVIELNPFENGTRVTIGAGQREGIDKTWKLRLVDKEGRDIRGGELTITVVGRTTTSATTKLLRQWIPNDVHAHVDSH